MAVRSWNAGLQSHVCGAPKPSGIKDSEASPWVPAILKCCTIISKKRCSHFQPRQVGLVQCSGCALSQKWDPALALIIQLYKTHDKTIYDLLDIHFVKYLRYIVLFKLSQQPYEVGTIIVVFYRSHWVKIKVSSEPCSFWQL